MRVKLKVTQGASTGKEVVIKTPKFLIGRGEECQLRPKSDSISRRHCLIWIKDSQVMIRDLGSKNGTIVNGEPVQGDRVLKVGDELRIGRLEFEVLIDYSLGGSKRPKVRDIKDAAARLTQSGLSDADINIWLEEGDEVDAVRKLAVPDTRQFKLDETDRVPVDTPSAPATADKEEEPKEPETSTEESAVDTEDIGKKKEPGKLPHRPQTMAVDSREAAADTLRKFFNRR